MVPISAITAAGLAFASSAQAAYFYSVADQYNPTDFMDESKWNWRTSSEFPNGDPTNGYINYVDLPTARDNLKIAGERDGQFFMGLDSSQATNTEAVSSVRIESAKSWRHFLIVGQFGKLPAPSCGVWPAFWTNGVGNWPDAGEMNMYEAWNLDSYNRAALHTGAAATFGSLLLNQNDMAGSVIREDCDNVTDGKYTGCVVADSGEPYGSDQGGVYAVQFESDRIRMWKWANGQAPVNLGDEHPDPETWGTPDLSTPPGQDVDNLFQEQQIILNIDVCGGAPDATWSTATNGEDVCSASTGAATCREYIQSAAGSIFSSASFSLHGITVWTASEQEVIDTTTSEPPAEPTTTISSSAEPTPEEPETTTEEPETTTELPETTTELPETTTEEPETTTEEPETTTEEPEATTEEPETTTEEPETTTEEPETITSSEEQESTTCTSEELPIETCDEPTTTRKTTFTSITSTIAPYEPSDTDCPDEEGESNEGKQGEEEEEEEEEENDCDEEEEEEEEEYETETVVLEPCTSTLYITSTEVVTSCAPTVTNCNPGDITTKVLISTTIIPASSTTIIIPASSSSSEDNKEIDSSDTTTLPGTKTVTSTTSMETTIYLTSTTISASSSSSSSSSSEVLFTPPISENYGNGTIITSIPPTAGTIVATTSCLSDGSVCSTQGPEPVIVSGAGKLGVMTAWFACVGVITMGVLLA